MQQKNISHWAKWGFTAFGVALVAINAALTFSFGFAYLGDAFGDGALADYAGAFYALLLFDLGYLAWFFTFVRSAESTGQRSLSLGMTIFSLLGSIAATLQQLATNSTSLVDLTRYHQGVGYAALGAMLLMTAGHIIATAGYLLLDPRERVKQTLAGVRAQLLDDSLAKAEKMIQLDQENLIAMMSQDVRADILNAMGFTHELKPITQPVLLSDNKKTITQQLEKAHESADSKRQSEPVTVPDAHIVANENGNGKAEDNRPTLQAD